MKAAQWHLEAEKEKPGSSRHTRDLANLNGGLESSGLPIASPDNAITPFGCYENWPQSLFLEACFRAVRSYVSKKRSCLLHVVLSP